MYYRTVQQALRIPENTDIRLDGFQNVRLYDDEMVRLRDIYIQLYQGQQIKGGIFHADKEKELYSLVLTACKLEYITAPVAWISEVMALESQYSFLNSDIVLLKGKKEDYKRLMMFVKIRKYYYGRTTLVLIM